MLAIIEREDTLDGDTALAIASVGRWQLHPAPAIDTVVDALNGVDTERRLAAALIGPVNDLPAEQWPAAIRLRERELQLWGGIERVGDPTPAAIPVANLAQG